MLGSINDIRIHTHSKLNIAMKISISPENGVHGKNSLSGASEDKRRELRRGTSFNVI